MKGGPIMKKIILIIAAALLCMAFSGCTVFETDTEALMQPPVFTEKQEKLNAALAEVAGEGYVLKYPESGEYNSAFIFKDLDNDGTEEAIAFYSFLDESTRINILKNEGEDWISVYEAAGFYGDINKIDFAEIDDKGPVLVVEWEQDIAVYRYVKERLEILYQSNCEGSFITDVDGSGKEDIIVFRGGNYGRSIVNIVCCEGEEVLVTDDISVNAEFGKIIRAQNGMLGEGENAFFIDAEVYEGIYLTEIITLEDGTAKRRFIPDFVELHDKDEEEEDSNSMVIVGDDYGKRGILLRDTAVLCMDINADGIMEMPVEYREDYAQEPSDQPFYIQYFQNGGDVLWPVWSGAANTENGFLFALPKTWCDWVIMSFGSSPDEMVFAKRETGEVVLKIMTVLKNDYQDKYEDYTLFAEDETKNYYIKVFVSENDEFYLSPEECKEGFIFI